MPTSTVHGILSELYRLLSTYGPSDFRRASSYGGVTDSMKAVLEALAKESETATPSVQLTRTTRGHKRKPPRSRRTISPSGQLSTLNLILHSRFFADPHALVSFAKQRGWRIQTNPKDSRERMARRLAKLIDNSPQDVRDQFLALVMGTREDQTQGWINVIKRAHDGD